MCFPFDDIYKEPLSDPYRKLDDLNNKLKFALIYFQVERVYDILENMSKELFIDFIENGQHGGVLRFKDKYIRMCDYPYSNLQSKDHVDECDKINQMLIDICDKYIDKPLFNYNIKTTMFSP
jgi:uncharacterized protein YlbG (UPF0298 family)